MAKNTKPRCSETITKPGMWRSFPCSRYGKVQRDGRWYCAQHDPEQVAKRAKEIRTRHNEKSRKNRIKWTLGFAGGGLLETCRKSIDWVESGATDTTVRDEICAQAKEIVKTVDEVLE